MDWLQRVRNAEKTCLIKDGKRKVHYKFSNNEEMAEEYNAETGVLISRAWKRESLSKKKHWEIEVGDPDPDISGFDTIGIKEAPGSPYIVKRITKKALEWRIRNLPYPIDTYLVTVKPNDKFITVQTTNKKYFKRINVPELERVNLLPQQENISFSHKSNTLIITYIKPPKVIEMESDISEEIKQITPINEGDLPCNPS